MNTPEWIKPAAYGAVAGAIAVALVGFMWGGWVTGGSARSLALEAADTSRTDLAAAVCAQNFLASDNARVNLAELKLLTSSMRQRTYIEDGDWAVMPDREESARATLTLCAKMLSGLEPAELPVVEAGEVIEEGAVIDATPEALAPAVSQ